MPTVTITLSGESAELALRRAKERGHSELAQYVRELVAEDAGRQDGPADGTGGEDRGAPPHLRADTREQLEALLHQTLDSPAREMTKSDWDEMKRRLIDSHSA
jgi:hypothetical protein